MFRTIQMALCVGILAAACVSAGTYNAKVAELEQAKSHDKATADQQKQLQAQIDQLKAQLQEAQSKLDEMKKQVDAVTAERDAARKEADEAKAASKKKPGKKGKAG